MNVMNVSNGLVRLNSQALQAKSALELKNAAQQQAVSAQTLKFGSDEKKDSANGARG